MLTRFYKQAFNKSATVHNLMKDINMIDSCQAHMYCTLPTSNSVTRSDTGVLIDSEPHVIFTCKTRTLFAPLAMDVYTGRSAFRSFYTPTKPLIRLHIKYKTDLFPKVI